MRPLTHQIPARRDGRGNSLPKRFAHARPGICADTEAVLDLTEIARDDPAAARMAYPRLKACQAIEVAKNAVVVREALKEQLRKQNEVYQTEAEDLETQLVPLREEAKRCDLVAIEACATAISLPTLSESDLPTPILPSDEAIAAGKSFVLKRPGSRIASALLKLAATLGAGTVFGISCGLLSGSLYLEELTANPLPLALWSLLGTAIVSLIGVTLSQLAGHIGEQSEWKVIHSEEPHRRPLWPMVTVTVALAAIFAAIESQVEKLGILRALREGQSFEAFAVSESELFIVSLLLALPVICWYLIDGYSQAVQAVRATWVAGEKERLDRAVRLTEAFRVAAKSCAEACHARKPVSRFEAELSAIKGKIRDDLTQTEREQIEDCEFDVLVADWAAEDALLDLLDYRAPNSTSGQRRIGILERIARLFRPRRQGAA